MIFHDDCMENSDHLSSVGVSDHFLPIVKVFGYP